MNGRAVLGLPAGAGQSEVLRAHATLIGQLVRAGAPDGLLALVAGARDHALGRPAVPPPPPHDILGVPKNAEADELRAAWRRVAQAAHPDHGGTDELFRLVKDAYDAATGRSARITTRWQQREPPPKPPVPGPFRAPPPERRVRGSRRRVVIELVEGLSLCCLTVAPFSLALMRTNLLVISVLLAISISPLGRHGLELAAGATASLRPRPRIHPDEAPDRFLEECALDVPVGREWDHRVYDAYMLWCRRNRRAGVGVSVFAEELRSCGLLHVDAADWGRRGLWVGLRLRDPLPL